MLEPAATVIERLTTHENAGICVGFRSGELSFHLHLKLLLISLFLLLCFGFLIIHNT